MPRDETINLLEETVNILKDHGKRVEDVRWVGDRDGWCSWGTFASLANFRYDNGFGGEEIATTLMVVGSDWWLERQEYDGSEWWEFKTLPTQPEKQRTPVTFRIGYSAKIWGGVEWEEPDAQ